VVRRISEPLQTDPTVMGVLRRVGALPEQVLLASAGPEGVIIARGGETAELDEDAAVHLFVRAF
jgi:DtxR family transcriptional regulator, Mn-dependent transcriptional regulator